MNDKKIYEEIRKTMFKNGSCTLNEWYLIRIVDGEKIAEFETICPKKGNIRIRIPITKHGQNYENEIIFKYKLFCFTNMKNLKDEGYIYSTRTDKYVNVH